jgi:RNA polymerase sigma factor (sigma-70 family)
MAEKKRIERCVNGDKLAYREFYDLYSKAMFNIGFRMLGNTEEAEDVIQESFLATFQQIGKIKSDAEFGGYIKRTVINKSIDLIRKRKVDFHSLDEAYYLTEEVENEDPAYDINVLRACIQDLPDGFRIVLTLFLFENYSHREIGAVLNITEGTSKSQYKRAREKLAALYKQKMLIHV